jgi:hypothetical protein
MHIATQSCGKHISAAVNQHATIEEAVFSMEAAPRLYNGNLQQLELELSRELSSAKISEKRWQLQQIIVLGSGVVSCGIELSWNLAE